ncbi:MAG: DUF4876 domain-containing protein, partial [Muribaculaceae bacterium]|nr:DUF4876 domain-containing protein [Muribaculaceae bacterium]
MNLTKKFLNRVLLCTVLAAGFAMTSCSDDNDDPTYVVECVNNTPEGLPAGYTVKSGTITYTELNTGAVTTFQLPQTATDVLPAGTYNVDAVMTVDLPDNGGERTLRAVAQQVVISATSQSVKLDWFFYNPNNTLVFGEIYFAGSLNATGKNGLYDTYFTIYNNTDEVQYADGIAIVESKFVNTSTDEILTEANLPQNNFTVQTVYVIPGSGKDVAIEPGKSIKIVDQAIDWSQEVAGALNHTDADFEWYDEVTTGSVRDTDNPQVPNLNKWFSYSATIWLPNMQCNKSYALVRMPAGMTAEKYLADYVGNYKYLSSTGKETNGTKAYLIPNSWILDGVNLCVAQDLKQTSLAPSVDMGIASIAIENSVANRTGKKFVRRTAGKSPAGNTILMDTN